MGVACGRIPEKLVVSGQKAGDGFDFERLGWRFVQFHDGFAGMKDDEFIIPLDPGTGVAAGPVDYPTKVEVSRTRVAQMGKYLDAIIVFLHPQKDMGPGGKVLAANLSDLNCGYVFLKCRHSMTRECSYNHVLTIG